DAVQPRMIDVASAPCERHHLVAVREQVLADGAADAGAAAGHRGNARGASVAFRRPGGDTHELAPTSASTRSGLPLPFSILSGGQISTAPAAGSRSRFERHCSP